MFDIGFPELVLVAIVGLLVIGPERLPEALRTLGLWLGRMRRSFTSVKNEIEKEIGMDEVRRQLHNEAIMDEMGAPWKLAKYAQAASGPQHIATPLEVLKTFPFHLNSPSDPVSTALSDE